MQTQTERRSEVVEQIARNYLRLETLQPRNRDSLDFHELAVWSIRQALELAYEAGRTSK